MAIDKTSTYVHVQLGQELWGRKENIKDKDPVMTTDATLIRTAVLALCDKWEREQAEKESALSKRPGRA